MRARHVTLGREHDRVDQREAHVRSQLRLEVARPAEIWLVLDADDATVPVGIAGDLSNVVATAGRAGGVIAFEEADLERALEGAPGALGVAVEGVFPVARSAGTDGRLDGGVGDRLARDRDAILEFGTGLDAEHVEDPPARIGDAAAELAGDDPPGGTRGGRTTRVRTRTLTR